MEAQRTRRADAELAVAIPTWRGGDLVTRCLASLARQTQPPDTVVIALARSRVPPWQTPAGLSVEVVEADRTTHFATTANRALRRLAGRDVVLLNDDTEAEPPALAALAQALRSRGPGIYQPLVALQGTNRLDNIGHRLFFDGFNVAAERGSPRNTVAPPKQAGAFSGAAVLLSAEVLYATGVFDEDFEAFGEDLDLSLRARRLGFPIHVVEEAVIAHQLGASYGRANFQKVHRVERNRLRAAIRSLPRSALLTLPVWTTWRLALTAGAALAGRGVGASVAPGAALGVVTGTVAGIAAAPEAWRKRKADQPGWSVDDARMWQALWAHRAGPRELWSQL